MTEFADIDPATGGTISMIPVSSAEEIDAAVRAARLAQPRWAAVPIEARIDALAAAAERLGERAEEIADLVTREMGKPRAEALAEVRGRARGMASTLEEVRTAVAEERVPGDGVDSVIRREALGVVAAITPWNFPVGMPMSILVPALATGNAVVFKPSEHVPLTGAVLAEIVGTFLPDGVLQVVQGLGDVGARLVAADVDMIGFVGSRETGMRIMGSAAAGLKRLVLELGGKDPLVVFADADLEAAAESAVRHSLRNAGQVCCSVERIYVADAVAEEFERLVVDKARGWAPSSGFSEGAKFGPIVSGPQRDKIHALVQDAVSAGARLMAGGAPLDGDGFFYPATVLMDVPASARLSSEETFGPVVSVSRFDGSEAEAVRLANSTPFGLGANVWTGDLERGMRVASGIRSGQVGVNRYLSAAGPWVGHGQSGFGFIGTVEGHRQFTVPKTISVQRS
ncbi:aldehyde dehydrogenase family protein [Engelhardtia mirabilis]|uniref:Succinate-semialdehyde dehydrogenase [NADP(+)] GabD n=1 Tax=Engelhardtia mirabilis TaxID=2528011 RepID=A0A518BKU3_9BACT|nr:Succinate-semialdehyde dehydrogenase [NADP(+)] GabD [Planctomycetes bacterium Pla133]QDV01926.1 Succinate-semialdehyde dehydrogenase [NADP(+)] GabD [Planctomycetes bacterium Pla86]